MGQKITIMELDRRITNVAGTSDSAEIALDLRMDTVEADLTTAQGDIVAAEADIATHTSTLASQATTIASHTTSIGTNTSGVATNTSEIANMKNGTSAFTVAKITEIHDTANNTKVMTVAMGGATPVNWIGIANSAAGAACSITTQGSDTDVDLAITPKGAGNIILGGPGRFLEDDTPVAVNSGVTIADAAASVEVVSPTVVEFNALVTKFNTLLAACETGRLLTP